jgi:hypothetical protein
MAAIGGQFPGGGAGPLQASSQDDAVTMLRAIAQNLSALVTAFAGLTGAAGTTGQFTMAAAASTVVPSTAVAANSMVLLTAANAAAGTLAGSAEAPYVAPADIVPGVSFTVRTASGAASGTEIFGYAIITTA